MKRYPINYGFTCRHSQYRLFLTLSFLWLVLVIPTLTTQAFAEDKQDAERALSYLDTHPEYGVKRFSPSFLTSLRNALAENDLTALRQTTGNMIVLPNGKEYKLQSDYLRLAELGAALRIWSSRANTVKLFRLAYSLASKELRNKVPDPERLGNLTNTELEEARDFLMNNLTASSLGILSGIWLPPTLAGCESELGYEDGTDQDALKCSAYSPNGIMRQRDFALRDDLTCVKNQARRGTCVAFAATAGVETSVHVQHGVKTNLSEQHAYWYGETGVGFSGRYTYGLNTMDYMDDLANSSYEFKKERVWNYNPSSSIGIKVGNTYPNSCVGYYGEKCTDYAFQADEDEVVIPMPPPANDIILYIHPDPNPNAGAYSVDLSAQMSTDQLGVDFTKLLLQVEIPVVMSFDVTNSFRSPDADGYVTYVPNEVVLGGHAILLVGWIDNADLPANAPQGSGGGYFILKNSWGDTAGDCGYYYVPSDFVLNYARGLALVISD